MNQCLSSVGKEQQKRLKEKTEKISGKGDYPDSENRSGVTGRGRVELDGKLLDGTVKNRISEISDKIHHATV